MRTLSAASGALRPVVGESRSSRSHGPAPHEDEPRKRPNVGGSLMTGRALVVRRSEPQHGVSWTEHTMLSYVLMHDGK